MRPKDKRFTVEKAVCQYSGQHIVWINDWLSTNEKTGCIVGIPIQYAVSEPTPGQQEWLLSRLQEIIDLANKGAALEADKEGTYRPGFEEAWHAMMDGMKESQNQSQETWRDRPPLL